MPSNPVQLSRRNLLELAAAGFVALVGPFGCNTPAHARDDTKRVSPTASRPSASVTVPLTPSPACSSQDYPVGTLRPFDPKARAFDAHPDDFETKRPPLPGDWMARFSETGLSFDEYVASRPTRRVGQRSVLVLQPLGHFNRQESELLNELCAFTEAFFDTKVRLAPTAQLPKRGRRLRQGDQGQFTQHHAGRILTMLAEDFLPEDAVCVLGITLDDLYPEPSWNYVFGEASISERVGVYSLARYQARFWGERDTDESRRLALLRSFKVLAHETGHMFSLPHCRRYECLMNGSNSLEEMDRQPIEPCPVCLKMLQYNLRFDIGSRYRRLQTIYARNELHPQSDWVKSRLRRIGCA